MNFMWGKNIRRNYIAWATISLKYLMGFNSWVHHITFILTVCVSDP